MSKRLIISTPSSNPLEPRIGGAALIGGIADWPESENGSPLVLVASIPNIFISNATGLKLAPELYTSVFSYYSEVDYFLDEITYHGAQDELECLRRGSTRVLQHPLGSTITQSFCIPPYLLELGQFVPESNDCGSRIGAPPCLLQNEVLDLQNTSFALQLRSSDFPQKYSDIFGISDALGYLYLREGSESLDGGLFFVQTT